MSLRWNELRLITIRVDTEEYERAIGQDMFGHRKSLKMMSA